MISLYNQLIFDPILSVFTFIYNKVAFNDFGSSIIVLTILVRIVLFPLFYSASKQQTIIQKIQPKIKSIQNDLKNNKEEQVKALMNLYSEHKINPFLSLLLVIVQLPVLIALYHVILKNASTFDNFIFLSFINLREKNLIIAVIAAAFQFLSAKLMLPKKTSSDPKSSLSSANMMLFLGPVLTFGILMSLPSSIGIYWLTTTILSIIQQIIINKHVYGGNIKKDGTTG